MHSYIVKGGWRRFGRSVLHAVGHHHIQRDEKLTCTWHCRTRWWGSIPYMFHVKIKESEAGVATQMHVRHKKWAKRSFVLSEKKVGKKKFESSQHMSHTQVTWCTTWCLRRWSSHNPWRRFEFANWCWETWCPVQIFMSTVWTDHFEFPFFDLTFLLHACRQPI